MWICLLEVGDAATALALEVALDMLITHVFLRRAIDFLLVGVLEYGRLGLLFSLVVRKTKKRARFSYIQAWYIVSHCFSFDSTGTLTQVTLYFSSNAVLRV